MHNEFVFSKNTLFLRRIVISPFVFESESLKHTTDGGGDADITVLPRGGKRGDHRGQPSGNAEYVFT